MTSSHDRERGSATLLSLGIIAAVFTLAMAGILLAQAAFARHTATGAADLAALAAASAHQHHRADPCQIAGHVVARHGATMTSCHLEGDHVLVRTQVAVDLGWVGQHQATANARAGPVP